MTPNTDRYKRINLDGRSINFTTTSAVALKGGQVVCLDNKGLAVIATAALVLAGAKLYAVVSRALSVDEAIPAGDSLTLDYMETGREFALLAAPETALTRDLALTVVDGAVALATPAEDADVGGNIRAYSVETYTTKAGKQELVRVRIA